MESRSEESQLQWVDDKLRALRTPDEWRPDKPAGMARLAAAREIQRTRQRRRVWMLGTLTLASACLLAVPGTRALAQRCVDACMAGSERVSRAIWQKVVAANFGQPAPPVADRQIAPDFQLTDASGKSIRLSAYQGKVVLLNFWATWCPPCRTEVPWFVEFQKTYGDRGFAVLGISLDEDGWRSVRPFLEAMRINYPVMVGSDDVVRSFGSVETLPTTLLIDRRGRIASAHVGLVTKATVESEIRGLLAER
jgi:cytochrome c biogenesis protein CcmG/thiol:disulfide interchange protein DsbE